MKSTGINQQVLDKLRVEPQSISVFHIAKEPGLKTPIDVCTHRFSASHGCFDPDGHDTLSRQHSVSDCHPLAETPGSSISVNESHKRLPRRDSTTSDSLSSRTSVKDQSTARPRGNTHSSSLKISLQSMAQTPPYLPLPPRTLPSRRADRLAACQWL
ncbi:hypothetical protein P692DRAFT_20883874 [Suillus brevipes Sb2]|nr:hypothetical protein P692DRAFT_20883874 [Suillus brevipes Sb2]